MRKLDNIRLCTSRATKYCNAGVRVVGRGDIAPDATVRGFTGGYKSVCEF